MIIFLKKILQVVVFSVVACTNSYALSQFSRACSIGEVRALIPEPTRTQALLFVKALSLMTPNEYVAIVAGGGRDYWALESITADYFGANRYYLFARAEVWRARTPPLAANLKTIWKIHSERNSDGWRNDQIDPDLAANPDITPRIANRRIRSARAGHPSIFEKVENEPAGWYDYYYVLGHHFYINPGDGVSIRLPNTEATNCNLGEWGFFDR